MSPRSSRLRLASELRLGLASEPRLGLASEHSLGLPSEPSSPPSSCARAVAGLGVPAPLSPSAGPLSLRPRRSLRLRHHHHRSLPPSLRPSSISDSLHHHRGLPPTATPRPPQLTPRSLHPTSSSAHRKQLGSARRQLKCSARRQLIGSARRQQQLGSARRQQQLGSARLQQLGSGDLLSLSDHVDPILLFLLLSYSCTSLVVFPRLIMWVIAVIFPDTCLKLITNFFALLGFLIVAYIASLCLASYTRVRDSTLPWYHRSHRWYFTTQPLNGCPMDFFKSNRGFLILLVTLALLGILTGFEIRTLFHAMYRGMNTHISHFQLSYLVLARYFCLAAAPSMLGDLEAILQTVQVRTDSFTSISIDLLPQQASSKESFWRHFSVIVLRLDLCCFLRLFFFACRCCNRYYYN